MASAVESAVVETELKKEETVIEDESKENKEEAVTDESKEEPVKEVEKEEPLKEEVEEAVVEEEGGEVEEKATNGEKRSSEHFATDTPGKRSRKSVEHFKPYTVEPVAKKAEEGRGLTLSGIPWVNEMLDKYSCEQLKPLHKLLFNNTVGKKQGIKQRIRKFNGYSFYAEDQKHASTLARIKKMSALNRDAIKKVMGLNKSCSVVELMEFLMEPQDKGKTVPKKSSGKATSKKRKSDSSSTPSAAKKQKKQIYSDSDSGSEGDTTTTPPKKAKISVTKKSSPKSDMPSDDVLTSKVKEVVGVLDLDTISMKQAVAKVSEAYPGLDLSEKKQLIKDVIKDMLD